MITEYDSSWRMAAPGQNLFSFISLNPGHYVFEVMATDASGAQLSSPAQYHFVILPPWYKTFWFRFGTALVLLALLFIGIRLYFIRRLQRQKAAYEKLFAVQEERQRIASEMHDDIGASLSGIRLQTEITRQKMWGGKGYEDVNKIHHSLTEIASKMKEVIWSLNTENDQLEHLVYYVRQQAFQLFEHSSIRLQVDLPGQIPRVVLKGETRRHIYLGVKEALHNCLRHSSATTCSIGFHFGPQALEISIKDNGVGIKSIEGSRNGLLNMKKRMEAVKGGFYVQNGIGAEIKFVIPISLNE